MIRTGTGFAYRSLEMKSSNERSWFADLEEEAESTEEILAGSELVLGPLLDRETFPFGAPSDRARRVWKLLGVEDRWVSDELAMLLFPEGVPADVDGSQVLRALRERATRERVALRDGDGDAGDRARRLVTLWALATSLHATAARSIGDLAAIMMIALAERWRRLADSTSTSAAA